MRNYSSPQINKIKVVKANSLFTVTVATITNGGTTNHFDAPPIQRPLLDEEEDEEELY